MLSLAEVRLRRGPQVLIECATCSIFRGEKAGIVGRNGCGKSPFDGDLEDYAAWLARSSDAPQAEGSETAATPSRREQRRLEAEARNRLTPLRAEQRKLEHVLELLTAERRTIESRLADPATYAAADADEQRRLSARHGELSLEISAVEERWLEVASTLETAG